MQQSVRVCREGVSVRVCREGVRRLKQLVLIPLVCHFPKFSNFMVFIISKYYFSGTDVVILTEKFQWTINPRPIPSPFIYMYV